MRITRLLLGCASITALAFAQHKNSPGLHNTRRSIVNGPAYLTEPFDIDATNVGPDFRGHDIAGIVKRLKESPELAQKSEFETSNKFQERLASFASQSLGGDLKVSSYLAFPVEYHSFFGTTFEYDAETQMLTASLTAKATAVDSDDTEAKPDTIVIRSSETYRNTYVGSNAYDVKVKVTRIDSHQYGLVLIPNSWMFASAPSYLRRFSVQLSMPPEEARVLKPEAKLVVICKLSYPWLHETMSGTDPTIDSPYERNDSLSFLQVVPEQLWLINGKTGTVVRKFSESSKQERKEVNEPENAAIVQTGKHCITSSTEMTLLEKIAPRYPPLARAALIQGDVEFTATIGTDGRLHDLGLLRGHPLLVDAARIAVEQYRYTPAVLNGSPVCVTTNVVVPFRLGAP